MSVVYPAPPLGFLRRLSRAENPARGALRSIPEYLQGRAALLTPEHMRELLRELGLLRIQFADKVFRDYCPFRDLRWSTFSLAR